MEIKFKHPIYAKYVKRLLDIVCSLMVLLCFWWVFAIVAVLVRINMGSPVIFKHRRPGQIDPATGLLKSFCINGKEYIHNAFCPVSFDDNAIAIASGQTQVLSFEVQRGAFTQDIADAKAFDMVLTFNFN